LELSSNTLALIFVILLVIVLLVGIIYAITSKNIRKGGATNSVTIFGATSQFQTLDQKAATEQILDEQAGKKMQDQESGDKPNQ
jgi:uncharacterized membrane protein